MVPSVVINFIVNYNLPSLCIPIWKIKYLAAPCGHWLEDSLIMEVFYMPFARETIEKAVYGIKDYLMNI